MTITKEFVLAVAEGFKALRVQADGLEKEPMYPQDNAVGRILRDRCESMRQQADLLSGWARRNAAAAGVDPEALDL